METTETILIKLNNKEIELKNDLKEVSRLKKDAMNGLISHVENSEDGTYQLDDKNFLISQNKNTYDKEMFMVEIIGSRELDSDKTFKIFENNTTTEYNKTKVIEELKKENKESNIKISKIIEYANEKSIIKTTKEYKIKTI